MCPAIRPPTAEKGSIKLERCVCKSRDICLQTCDRPVSKLHLSSSFIPPARSRERASPLSLLNPLYSPPIFASDKLVNSPPPPHQKINDNCYWMDFILRLSLSHSLRESVLNVCFARPPERERESILQNTYFA